MPSMPPLSHSPLSSLHCWHNQQQPLVRALASSMVGEMSSALGMMQGAVDERDVELAEHAAHAADQRRQLAAVQERLRSLESEAKATAERFTEQLEQSQTDLTASTALTVELVAKLEATTDRIDVLERKLYGRRSEKRKPKTPDARRAARKRRRDEMTDEEKKARRKAAEARRQAKLDALRTVTYTVTLPEGYDSGRKMPSVNSVVYEWHPGELVRVEVSREQRAMPQGLIVTAPPVDQVVEGGSYGPALYAKICVDKCLNAMPLRRQERAFARMGVPLPASTLCAQFHRAGDSLRPIYKALLAHVSSTPHVNADETPLPVLDDNGTHKGWMWVFATSEALLFQYSTSRGKGVPEAVLGHTMGTLTVDGYTAYNSVTGALGRLRGGCWSHGRRGLYEVRQHDEAFVQPLLDDIGELFYVEELAAENGILGTPEHLTLRKTMSAPVVDRIFAALDE